MPSLTKGFEIMVAATLKKNLGHSMPKHNDDYSCFQEDQEPEATSNFLCPVILML